MGCSASLANDGAYPTYPDTAIMTPTVAAGVPVPYLARNIYIQSRESTTRVLKTNGKKQLGKVKPLTAEDESEKKNLCVEYDLVITEFSSPDRVQQIEEFFHPPANIDELFLEGQRYVRKESPREKEQNEQRRILEVLRQEGLVLRPEARATGGLRFEIVSKAEASSEPHIHQLPPLRLRKHRRRKKDQVTREEIERKLHLARERRKQQEEEKVQRAMTGRLRLQEVATVLVQHLRSKKEKLQQKMENTSSTRERQMQELRERLKAHAEHAERVRHRKELSTKALHLGRESHHAEL